MNVIGVVLGLARAQHGVVARWQLLAAGVTARQISCALRDGLLAAMHAGVYRVDAIVAPMALQMAALLTCPGGVLGHRSAAELHGILPVLRSGTVDLCIPPAAHRGRRPGIRARRVAVPECDIVVIDGIRVTSVARTLVDLSAVVSPRVLEQALAAAEREKLVIRAEVLAALERRGVRRGTANMRALLKREAPPAFVRSPAEDGLVGLVRAAGFPEPQWNVGLHGVEVDCFWPVHGLVVEVDGFAYHDGRRAFVRDRRRDARLAAEGIQVLRLSWDQIHRERERTIAQLSAALARRSVRP